MSRAFELQGQAIHGADGIAIRHDHRGKVGIAAFSSSQGPLQAGDVAFGCRHKPVEDLATRRPRHLPHAAHSVSELWDFALDKAANLADVARTIQGQTQLPPPQFGELRLDTSGVSCRTSLRIHADQGLLKPAHGEQGRSANNKHGDDRRGGKDPELAGDAQGRQERHAATLLDILSFAAEGAGGRLRKRVSAQGRATAAERLTPPAP
ncbi:hypothetical protein [Elioraea thermophila]|uniref:hypothetical protein n=1 Tax=Elioraea thermophila TaxID=2185104 RepID=UPI0018E4E5B5|nr:hypothetical protein [Elioraea thermophila]